MLSMLVAKDNLTYPGAPNADPGTTAKLSLAVVPGSAFGAPGYVRLSFATSMDNIKLSVDKLASI